MSKHYMHYQCRVMHDIQCMSIEQLEELYDITVDQDGTVWDNCEGKEFSTLSEWGLFIEELNRELDEDEHIVKTGKRRYDDDY
jgi:hypothetical protein